MRHLQYCSFIAFAAVALSASAQDVSQCDKSLSPTIEQASEDYSIAQAYAYVNAEREFDELRNKSERQRGLSVIYTSFIGEYNDSRNSSEFKQRVRDRLTQENFSLEESEARASYRRFLTPAQLEAWSKCVQSVTNGGSVILIAKKVSSTPFPIQVSWRPARGVGNGTLTLEVRGATIAGQNIVTRNIVGASDIPFILQPERQSQQIIVTAEIAGSADELVLPRAFQHASPILPPKPRSTVRISASAFMQPLNVALGGPNNVYGTDVLLNAPPYRETSNGATWEFNVSRGGTYLLKVEYAAAAPRPVRISINGKLAFSDALGAPTGCWDPKCQQTLHQGRVDLQDGLNTMRVERNGVFPHIRSFIFEPVD